MINKESEKIVRDLLNKERSELSDLTRVKLDKTINTDKIEIKKARVEVLVELLNKIKNETTKTNK